MSWGIAKNLIIRNWDRRRMKKKKMFSNHFILDVWLNDKFIHTSNTYSWFQNIPLCGVSFNLIRGYLKNLGLSKDKT